MEVEEFVGAVLFPLNSMNPNLKVTLKIKYKFLVFIKYILYLQPALHSKENGAYSF
jgi:hypothetical protein